MFIIIIIVRRMVTALVQLLVLVTNRGWAGSMYSYSGHPFSGASVCT
jgi:hypothetical protein